MSASIGKGDISTATSERRHVVYNAKGELRLNRWNSGLPKGRNPQGNGSVIVGTKTQTREFSTKVRKSKDSPKLEAHAGQKSLGEMIMYNKDGKCNNAYSIIAEKLTLESAYMRIKSEPGNMTPGSDKETLDGISDEWFTNVSKQLITEGFRFKPTRRVYIPKTNGKMRPLGVAPPRDKIIQEAFRAVLEQVIEPKFLPTSHGFRPNRGCHTALAEIRYWNGVK